MAQRKADLDGLAVVLLVGCCLTWAAQQVLVKLTIAEVAPMYQASIRFAVATMLVIAWSFLRGKALLKSDGSWLPGILVGGLFALEFAGIYLGLQNTTVARLTIFLYTAPFWVTLLLPLFHRNERLGLVQWIGMAVAFTGVVIAFRDGVNAPGRGLLGDIMGIVAGAAWGLTTVVIRSSTLARVSPEKVLLYQVGVSAMVLPVVSFCLGEPWHVSFSSFAVASIGFQAGIGAFATYLLWMWMLGRYPATRMSSFTFLVPVSALGFGVLLLKEPLNWSLVPALLGVASGIVLVNRRI